MTTANASLANTLRSCGETYALKGRTRLARSRKSLTSSLLTTASYTLQANYSAVYTSRDADSAAL